MWDRENGTTIEDKAEFYRQNYEDALDLIRELKWRIKELEIENNLLNNDINRAENFIYSENK